MDPTHLWRFLLVGYFVTIAIETPILLIGLSRKHSLTDRLIAGVMLTACTYPIVILVMPLLFTEQFGRGVYLAVAETFAPAAECGLFYLAFMRRYEPGHWMWRDFAAIVVANLASFGLGELIF